MNSEFKTIRKPGDAFRIRLEDVSPELGKEDDGSYTLRFTVGKDLIEVGLSPPALQTLVLQCVMQIPDLVPQHTQASVEDAYRQSALFILAMDNRSLQTLLREIHSEELVDFLWYMKSAELIRHVCRNMAQRAAEMLVEDLSLRWSGNNPDTALETQARCGRAAVLEILSIVRRLADEGQIICY